MKVDVFTNNFMGEGVGVNIFEKGLNSSTNCGQQVPCRAQTAQLLNQTSGVCTSLSF